MPQRGLDASAGLAFEGVVVKLQVKKAQRVVVDGACGRVGGGGLLAVLGASGAGKTTLLAALAGEVACEGLVDRQGCCRSQPLMQSVSVVVADVGAPTSADRG